MCIDTTIQENGGTLTRASETAPWIVERISSYLLARSLAFLNRHSNSSLSFFSLLSHFYLNLQLSNLFDPFTVLILHAALLLRHSRRRAFSIFFPLHIFVVSTSIRPLSHLSQSFILSLSHCWKSTQSSFSLARPRLCRESGRMLCRRLRPRSNVPTVSSFLPTP